jgi:spore germination protein KC
MKIKKIVVVVMAFFQIIVLSGCWDSREIDTLAITICVGIDKNKDGYIVTQQILNPGNIISKEGKNFSPVIIYSDTGKDIFEIFRRLTTQSPRKMYVSHLKMFVFGQKVAEEGIQEIIDFFARGPEFRSDYYFIVAKDTTAKDVLSIQTPLEIVPGMKLYESLETSEKAWAPTKAVRIFELINCLTSDGKDPVMTGIEITSGVENSESTEALSISDDIKKLKYSSLGVFKKDKLIGWLDENESKGYNYIIGNVDSTVEYVNYEDISKITLEVKSAKSKIKVMLVDDKPAINVEINLIQNITAIEGNFDPINKDNEKNINDLSEEKIKSMCNKTINKVQKELKSDIFGFGDEIHRKYPELWEELKYNWDEEFSNLPVITTVNVKINQLGQFIKPYFMEE